MSSKDKTLLGSSPGNLKKLLAELVLTHFQATFPTALPRGKRTRELF